MGSAVGLILTKKLNYSLIFDLYNTLYGIYLGRKFVRVPYPSSARIPKEGLGARLARKLCLKWIKSAFTIFKEPQIVWDYS